MYAYTFGAPNTVPVSVYCVVVYKALVLYELRPVTSTFVKLSPLRVTEAQPVAFHESVVELPLTTFEGEALKDVSEHAFDDPPPDTVTVAAALALFPSPYAVRR